MDSRDSLDKTPDSIDLTESPVKHTNTQRQIERLMKTQVIMIQMKQLYLMEIK